MTARKVLVTGGCGFIGSNFIRWLLRGRDDVEVTNLDLLTYAGNPENLDGVDRDPRYRFVQGDVADSELVRREVRGGCELVFHFAAESHVDRALYAPGAFVRTNVVGTCALLEAARERGVGRFVQISTDEVYGSAPPGVAFDEEAALKPSSAYSASKAGADHLALAYHRTYGLPVIVTRSSNNYGPYQHPEKFLPLFITNALAGEPLPLYGDGRQERDWLHVEDNVRGIWAAAERGRPGEVYNLGAGRSRANVEVAQRLLRLAGRPDSLLRPVADRPGHDRRYALSAQKAGRELGWEPQVPFEEGLAGTVEWYRTHGEWVEHARAGAQHKAHLERHYGSRLPRSGHG